MPTPSVYNPKIGDELTFLGEGITLTLEGSEAGPTEGTLLWYLSPRPNGKTYTISTDSILAGLEQELLTIHRPSDGSYYSNED